MKCLKKMFFIFLLLIPVYVFAESDIFWHETDITAYYAYVDNVNGSTAYCVDEDDSCDKEIIIPHSSKIEIIREFYNDGELYAEFEHENKRYYLKLEDLKPSNDYAVDDIDLSSSIGLLFVYKDIYLYDGPSYVYESKNVIIPRGTILKYYYSDWLWAYVEYNGQMGWVNYYNYEGVSSLEKYSGCAESYNFNFYLFDEVNVFSEPISDSNVIGIIPKGTDIKINYVFNGSDVFYYIEYENIKGWIMAGYDKSGYSILNEKGYSIFSLKELNIYSDIEGNNAVSNIPKYTEVFLNYAVYNENTEKYYYYVKYNGVDGWVIGEDEKDLYSDLAGNTEKYLSIKLSSEIELTDSETNEKIIVSVGDIIYLANMDYISNEDDANFIYYNGKKYNLVEYQGENYFKYRDYFSDDDTLDSNNAISTQVDDLNDEKTKFDLKIVIVIILVIVVLISVIIILNKNQLDDNDKNIDNSDKNQLK